MRNRPLHPSSFIPHPSRRSRAFTFAEIMFAVVILGVGFIMVAAMFPVAIRQTQTTLTDVTGVAEAARAQSLVQQLGVSMAGYYDQYTKSTAGLTDPTVPAFGNIIIERQHTGAGNTTIAAPLQSFYARPNTAIANARLPVQSLLGDMINQYDHRFAFIPIAYQADLQPTDVNGNPLAEDVTGFLYKDTTGRPGYYTLPTSSYGAVYVNLVPPSSATQVYDSNGNKIFDSTWPVAQDLIKLTDITNTPVTPVARVLPHNARVWLVAVQKRDPDSPEYTSTDLNAGVNNNTTIASDTTGQRYNYLATINGTFVPKRVYFKLVEGENPNTYATAYPDSLVFTDSGGTPVDEPAADTGAYVWVADDQVTAPIAASGNGIYSQYAYSPGAANGRFYRLGARVSGVTGVWELQPGNDMSITKNPGPDAIYDDQDDGIPTLENLPPRPYDGGSSGPHPYASALAGNSNAYSNITGANGNTPAAGVLIGKSLKNPAAAYNVSSNPYVGTAQDIFALPPVTVQIKQ